MPHNRVHLIQICSNLRRLSTYPLSTLEAMALVGKAACPYASSSDVDEYRDAVAG
jgi:hypothetical protein